MDLVVPKPSANEARLKWDLREPIKNPRYEEFWANRFSQFIPKEVFDHPTVNLEIGAGTGAFITALAETYPDRFFVAIDRCRIRAKRLVHKTKKAGRDNLIGIRGNAIPALIHGIPSESIDRIYIMYPAPWPKTSQRKNRWYLHPAMVHLVRVLKPGGLFILTSDQKFYIDESRYVCENSFKLKILVHGEIAPNAYNDLHTFPEGRTKFERTFLAQGQKCYEVICQK